jgi:hypothetical protein
MCHPIWLLSRKYGTVWYHPASSKFWYLTALSFVNFQEKLTGTSFTLCACEASFVRLAVCLAPGARFASTGFPQISPIKSQEKGLENNPRKTPRKGSENHHQVQPGTTQQGLEEPRRIIYTCHKGSYKV